jgi:hypothetical protein
VPPNPTSVREQTLDAVQVFATIDSKPNFGSGRIVGENLVLTARHVVASLDSKVPGVGISVLHFSESIVRNGAEAIPAELAWEPPPGPDGRWPDVVVLRLKPPPDAGPILPKLPLGFAECPGAPPQCAWAVAFPWCDTPEAAAARARNGGGPNANSIPGTCHAKTWKPPKLHFASQFFFLGRPDEAGATTASRWAGASGGVVVVEGRIVGVFEKIDRTEMPHNQITVVPVFGHADDAWERLGLSKPLSLHELPIPTGFGVHVPVSDDRKPLVDHLYTLNRHEQMTSVETVILESSTEATEVLVTGSLADICEEFWKTFWWRQLNRCERTRPLPLYWPGLSVSADQRLSLLASGAMKIISSKKSPRLQDLVAELHATPLAPWICLHLPPTMRDADYALLTQWRNAWASVRRGSDESFGYFLLRMSEAHAAEDLKGLGKPNLAHVKLGPVEPHDLYRWDSVLQNQAPSGGTPLLPRLARAFRDELQGPLKHLDGKPLPLAIIQAAIEGRIVQFNDPQAGWA